MVSRIRSTQAKRWTKICTDLPPEEEALIPQVAGSLDEALDNLDQSRAVFTKGGVMSDAMIDAYIALKRAEAKRVSYGRTPTGIRTVLQRVIAAATTDVPISGCQSLAEQIFVQV